MKTRLFAIPLLAAALVSCDKAKKIASDASSAVSRELSKATATDDSGKVDEDLQKLVDQTPEGAIFRKDLPFPTRLEVHTKRRDDLSGRFVRSSEIEKMADTVKGAQISETKLERAGDQIRYTLENSSFKLPALDKADGEEAKAADPLEQAPPTSRPVVFKKTGGKWKTEGGDFRSAVLNQQVTPRMDTMLVENTLAPRPMWFAKQRIKIGDQMEVTGDMLAMLRSGDAKGKLTIKLESFGAVAGHPCGVFTVTGSFSRKDFVNFEGNTIDEDVTIESGKLWLSLIHPVILREELETIQSFKSGGGGGQLARGQGSVKVSVTRDWKILK